MSLIVTWAHAPCESCCAEVVVLPLRPLLTASPHRRGRLAEGRPSRCSSVRRRCSHLVRLVPLFLGLCLHVPLSPLCINMSAHMHKRTEAKLTACLEREPLPPVRLLVGVRGLLVLVRSFSSSSDSGRRDRRRLRILSSGSNTRRSSPSGGKCHSTTGMRHATRPVNRMKKNTPDAARAEMRGKREIKPLPSEYQQWIRTNGVTKDSLPKAVV